MSLRVHAWYQELTRDTVVVAHGGVLRGLLVQLGIATPKEAPFLDVTQGVVFVIRAQKHRALRTDAAKTKRPDPRSGRRIGTDRCRETSQIRQRRDRE